jgi:Coenzyme PQQ synthesis protein D (PqqD)
VAQVSLDSVCRPSEDIVAREIDGNILIVPLVAAIVEAEGHLFALNTTGRAIWQKLDGRCTLKDVVALLAGDFATPSVDIEHDVVKFADELTRRRLLVIRGAFSGDQ